MNRMRWMSDENEAARHPWKATTTMWVIGSLFFGIYSYFRWDHRNMLVSALIGSCFGLLLAALAIGRIGQIRGWPAWIGGREGDSLRTPVGLAVLWPGIGLGIVIWGATSGSLPLALAGLPLIALGAAWYLIKHSVGR
jgi:hypothetical protein